MTVDFLTKMLVENVLVTIKDFNTGRVLWTGEAKNATFPAIVADWNFSKGHVIFVYNR